MNFGVPADANEKDYEPVKTKPVIDKSPALSMKDTIKNSIKTRKIAFLIGKGVDDNSVAKMKTALEKEGATVKLIAPKLGAVKTAKEQQLTVGGSFLTDASVCYDAVFIPAGKHCKALAQEPDAIHFINEAFRHCKAIAADGEAVDLLQYTYVNPNGQHEKVIAEGVLLNKQPRDFINAIAKHRFWERELARKVPA